MKSLLISLNYLFWFQFSIYSTRTSCLYSLFPFSSLNLSLSFFFLHMVIFFSRRTTSYTEKSIETLAPIRNYYTFLTGMIETFQFLRKYRVTRSWKTAEIVNQLRLKLLIFNLQRWNDIYFTNKKILYFFQGIISFFNSGIKEKCMNLGWFILLVYSFIIF